MADCLPAASSVAMPFRRFFDVGLAADRDGAGIQANILISCISQRWHGNGGNVLVVPGAAHAGIRIAEIHSAGTCLFQVMSGV